MNDSSNPTENSGGLVESAIALSEQIDRLVIEHQALERVPRLLRDHFNSSQVFLVADENTMQAAGSDLISILEAAGIEIKSHIFPGSPRLKAKVENAEAFMNRLDDPEVVPLAIGSGVVNDLVKYAAFNMNRAYLCVATAASMDGYASMGSPLSQKGFKHTIPCVPPRVIVADLDVLANAPKEMTAWGYGDLAGKIPAGGDWLIADALGIEPLDSQAWPMISANLRAWLSNPAGVAMGDPKAMADLFEGLAISGVAMELHNSSRPASGADHQIAHMWEMDGLAQNGEPVSHGTCVALGTLTVLALYKWLLEQDMTGLKPEHIIQGRQSLADLEREIQRRFPEPSMAERVLIETRHKYVDDEALAARIQMINRVWPTLKNSLRDYLIPSDEMKKMLLEAGVDVDPSAVGISPEYHKETVLGARLIRRRYTVLDFLEDAGLLDQAVEHIFSDNGPWSRG